MIISQTPIRVSFFGGGTDYPAYLERSPGLVFGSAINKYIYINILVNPLRNKKRFRLVYSKVEEVDHLDDIEHPAIRAVLRYFNLNYNFEIISTADIPARTGLGSSSSFTVGLIRGLFALKGEEPTPKKLAELAHEIEIDHLGENVGLQDQIFAAYGNVNFISMTNKRKFRVQPILMSKEHISALNQSLLLIYLGGQRSASCIAKTIIKRTSQGENDDYLKQMFEITNNVKTLIFAKYRASFIEEFADLLNESWMLKRMLSSSITNDFVDQTIKIARENGAYGGKLLGAGGTGMLALIAPQHNHKSILNALSDLQAIPIKLGGIGSKIISH